MNSPFHTFNPLNRLPDLLKAPTSPTDSPSTSPSSVDHAPGNDYLSTLRRRVEQLHEEGVTGRVHFLDYDGFNALAKELDCPLSVIYLTHVVVERESTIASLRQQLGMVQSDHRQLAARYDDDQLLGTFFEREYGTEIRDGRHKGHSTAELCVRYMTRERRMLGSWLLGAVNRLYLAAKGHL